MQDYHHIIANTCLYSRIQSLFCVNSNRYKNNEIIHYYPLASHQRKIVFTRICYKVKIPLFGWWVELISPGCFVKDVGVVVIVESTGNIVVTSGPIKRKMQRYNNVAPHCLTSNRFIKSRTRLVNSQCIVEPTGNNFSKVYYGLRYLPTKHSRSWTSANNQRYVAGCCWS